MYNAFITYSSVDEHLGWFHFHAIRTPWIFSEIVSYVEIPGIPNV